MKRMLINVILSAVFFFMLPAELFAQSQFMFGIQANRSAIEIFGEKGFYIRPSTIYVGANGLYYEDKYTVYGVHAMVGNVIHRGLTGKIGFKGAGGEFKRRGKDNPDLAALAFSVSGRYDLSEIVASHYVPLILHVTLNYSPRPLSFKDSERFFETLLSADWMLLENAAITACFRYLDVNFNGWSRTHGSGYLGFKFIF